ncbi:response regulator transcription factor [Streptomyces sp. RFCAC02]|uniref:response regulator transcription factor n=1 Tax=Streptomyces sp. RFCAC02 TaxID=2499143 RepID=UPI0010214AF0|nr:response regulator transcription factor [Streptomyces sp. RFCAC02]
MDGVIRVVVADDDALVRAGLVLILGADPGIEVVAEAGDGEAAVAAVRAHRPDVVLMDIRMPRMDGLAATEAVRAGGAGPAVVVLTTFNTDAHVLGALRAGASGFLLKDVPPTDFLNAVRTVARGESMLSPAVTTRLIGHVLRGGGDTERDRRARRARSALAALSDRERDVALAVGRGGSNADIARELFMSVPTVKTYVSRILGKLECDNRVQVAILVHEAGLGDAGSAGGPAGERGSVR